MESGAFLGGSCGILSGILGGLRSWHLLGPSWEVLGRVAAILEGLGGSCGPLGSLLGGLGSVSDGLELSWDDLEAILV